jgi:trimeric autotransporter adhesin
MGRVTVFYANAKTKGSNFAGRARDASVAAAKAAAASKAAQAAAAAAQSAAQAAAQTAASAAQAAAAGVNKGVQQGVYSARGWAAPMLENAADYTTSTAAPKVASALRVAARQVRPEDTSRNRTRSIITWSALGAAVLAALGAGGALARKRFQGAITADTEAEATEGTATPPAPADAPSAESSDPAATSTDAGANGRVSTSGW